MSCQEKKPSDAYRAVADNAKRHIDPKWRDHIDRGVAKRLVMTIPYNAKFKSNWGYVNSALNDPIDEGGKGLNVPKEDVTAITHALRNSTFEIFPGPTRVMKWIEDEVGKAMKRGEKEIVWSTPSGFIVSQKLMKAEVVQMKLQLLGQVRKVTVATGDSDEVNKSKHKAATAPNLIHSLDASLLHLSALRFDAPISLIHDSVLCRATDMSTLSRIVRETYFHLFAESSFLEVWAEQIGAETEPPMINTLNLEAVIESTYFFLLMPRVIHKTEQPVVLEGYQAVLKPSKFGYSLATTLPESMIAALEEDRAENLKWAESKLKNPKRSTLKPEPWEEVADGQYKVKFSYNEETKPPIVDTEGTPITDESTPL